MAIEDRMRSAAPCSVVRRSLKGDCTPCHAGISCTNLERTWGLAYQGRGDTRVACGGLDAVVAEQNLDHAQVGASLEQVRGKAVAKHVGRDPLLQANLRRSEFDRFASGVWI